MDHHRADFPPSLVPAIEAAADHAAIAREPWWIIGSAVVALSGVPDPVIADVDLLTSARDADRIMRAAGVERDRVSDRSEFRSVYGRLPSPTLPIEVMGGLEVLRNGRWTAIEPATRRSIKIGRATVFIPGRDELIAILTLFARPKDIARAAMLRGLDAVDRAAPLA